MFNLRMQLLEILRCIWRGAWRPMFLLPPQPKWYDHVDYWFRRTRDVIAGVLLFLIPPGAVYFIHEKYALNPGAALAFTAVIAVVWVFAVIACYFAGKRLDGKR